MNTGLKQRKDDGIIDNVAIKRTLQGQHVLLTRREQKRLVRRAPELNATELASILRVSTTYIVRLLREMREDVSSN